jgi:hypothetical protein
MNSTELTQTGIAEWSYRETVPDFPLASRCADYSDRFVKNALLR